MSALTQDSLTRRWLHGMPREQTRPGKSQFAAGKIAYLGSMNLFADGVAQPVVSGAPLVALCTTIPGADVNGGVVLRARDPNVTVQFAAGASKTLSVTSITYGASIAILIQQGTDGGAATTNTAAQMCNLIRSNAETDRLLACAPTGNGSGLTATAAATPIAHIAMGGVPERQINNSDSVTVLQLRPSIVFNRGIWGVQGDPTTPPTLLNGNAYLVDDQTVSGTADPLALRAPLRQFDDGIFYIDLCEAQ